MADWSHLPADVHHAVFKMLAQDVLAVRPSKRRLGRPRMQKHGLSRYALVCKDWQPFFEKQLYHHLTLTQASLPDFQQLVIRQRGLVKHIWLKIELGTYECPSCVVHSPLPRAADDSTTAEAITSLLQVLTTWDRDQVACPGSLTLEISAHSPSDLEHVFMNDLYFDTSSWAVDELQHDAPPLNDMGHGWANGRRTRPPREVSISQLFGHLHFLLPDFGHLPQVQLVGDFVLRRQTRRTFRPKAVAGLLQSFPNLGSITYEPWRQFFCEPRPREYCYIDPGHCHLISKSLPKALRELTLFEDFNEDYNTVICADPYIANDFPNPPELIRTPSPAVGQALAERSLSLARLSASYIIDAHDFFAAVNPAWVWEGLVSLSLTSRLLVDKTPHADITCLLVKAGIVALQMPQLKRMHKWNGTKGNACAFSYEATDQHTMIEWRGTWHMPLDLDIADVWSRVAQLYTRRDLTVAGGENLDKAAIKSHAVAIRQLGLGERGVVHPESLKQIEKETERYWYE